MKMSLLLLIFLSLPGAHATVSAGVGISSYTAGRIVPALSLAAELTPAYLLSGQSTGVKSGYYSHSGYAASLYRVWSPGAFWWGPLRAGVGLGFFYAEHAFRDGATAPLEKQSDYGGGPALRMDWNFAGPVYLSVESLFGLKKISPNLLLTYQDITQVSVGLTW
jgi:hypothetical protein